MRQHEELEDVIEQLFDEQIKPESLTDSQLEEVLDELADRAPTKGYVVY